MNLLAPRDDASIYLPPLSKAIDVRKVLGRRRPWRRRRKQLLSFGPLSDGQELRRLDSNFGK
jgi:hypothetical protein